MDKQENLDICFVYLIAMYIFYSFGCNWRTFDVWILFIFAVPRSKKRPVAVVSTLRSNKKVSSLVDKVVSLICDQMDKFYYSSFYYSDSE